MEDEVVHNPGTYVFAIKLFPLSADKKFIWHVTRNQKDVIATANIGELYQTSSHIALPGTKFMCTDFYRR